MTTFTAVIGSIQFLNMIFLVLYDFYCIPSQYYACVLIGSTHYFVHISDLSLCLCVQFRVALVLSCPGLELPWFCPWVWSGISGSCGSSIQLHHFNINSPSSDIPLFGSVGRKISQFGIFLFSIFQYSTLCKAFIQGWWMGKFSM